MARVPGARGRMSPSWAQIPSLRVAPDTLTLWILVALELGAMTGMRHYFRRHHGG